MTKFKALNILRMEHGLTLGLIQPWYIIIPAWHISHTYSVADLNPLCCQWESRWKRVVDWLMLLAVLLYSSKCGDWEWFLTSHRWFDYI